jgi:N-glycosylase/DNA lyase
MGKGPRPRSSGADRIGCEEGNNMGLGYLRRQYEVKKLEIKRRIEEFRRFGRQSSKEDLFAEVAYCICTPQTNFPKCQAAMQQLQQNKLLFSGGEDVVSFFLKKNGVRFHNNKGKYIIAARAKLYDNGCQYEIKGLVANLLSMPQRNAREYLRQIKIPGLGMKESSHFLRNVGHGDELALLDRHILRKLQEFGVIRQAPKTLTSTKYETIEENMGKWAKEVGIPLGELDLLLWSEETGEIFK